MAQETIARRYVQNWEKVRKENIGLLFWGDVGTGKTYLAFWMPDITAGNR